MKKVFLTIGLSAASIFMTAQTVRYVANNGNTVKDGLTWATASDDLQAMIDAAQAGWEVWVAGGAGGVYTPKYDAKNCNYFATPPILPSANPAGIGPDNSFVLKPDVRIFGGFAGWEISRSQRDWVVNETVLDGNSTSYHVVISAGAVGSACLDGFTVRNSSLRQAV